MTVDTTENKQEIILNTDKVETNQAQKKPEASATPQSQQKPQENKIEDAPAEDPNWRAFREARKKDRADREAAERKALEKEAEISALKAAMEAAFSKSAPTPQAYQQYYGMNAPTEQEETEDERIERKVQAALSVREAAAEKSRLEREQQEYPNRLSQTYPDFNHIISQDNLDYLDYHYPEVSRPLQRLKDGYDKWSDIYQAIKKFVPNTTTAKKDAARAEANFNKPKSISSTSITQPGEAVGSARLTEEKRASNWERMQKILKGVS
jgi:hypothetical protein